MPKNYPPEALHEAVAAVVRGDLSLSAAALQYGVPCTTVHLQVKNLNMRRMEAMKNPKGRNKVDEQDLKTALKEVQSGKMTYQKAGDVYGIAPNTLRRHVKLQRNKAMIKVK